MESIFKDKLKLNLSIDIIMLLLMMPIAGIGLLIKYVLIPGMQRNSTFGNNVDLEFLGMTRHQWGTIHLILGIVFLSFLALHIILHWKMIMGIFQRMVPGKTLQLVCTFMLIALSLTMIAFPLIVEPEITERTPLHQNRDAHSETGYSLENQPKKSQMVQPDSSFSDKPKMNVQDKHFQHKNELAKEEYEINGSLTLQFVADKYGIPANKLADDLNIPETLVGEKLGRLRKQYPFTMDDVKKSISTYQKRW